MRNSATVRIVKNVEEDFFRRSRVIARKLDRGEKLEPGTTLTFASLGDMVRLLSAERVRLLKRVKAKPVSMTKLAAALGRDKSAVARDVAVLERSGLLRTGYVTNPGHGRLRVVQQAAESFEMVAGL